MGVPAANTGHPPPTIRAERAWRNSQVPWRTRMTRPEDAPRGGNRAAFLHAALGGEVHYTFLAHNLPDGAGRGRTTRDEGGTTLMLGDNFNFDGPFEG